MFSFCGQLERCLNPFKLKIEKEKKGARVANFWAFKGIGEKISTRLLNKMVRYSFLAVRKCFGFPPKMGECC